MAEQVSQNDTIGISTSHTVCYIGIGSNLQDPLSQCRKSIAALTNPLTTTVYKVSSYYQSEPLGPADQPRYINLVAQLGTTLKPLELLDFLQAIEHSQGRVRGRRWGERTLDLDLLLYADKQINCARLSVPHPGITQRSFVLLPLLEIDPKIHIPGLGAAADFAQSVNTLDIKRVAPPPSLAGESRET